MTLFVNYRPATIILAALAAAECLSCLAIGAWL